MAALEVGERAAAELQQPYVRESARERERTAHTHTHTQRERERERKQTWSARWQHVYPAKVEARWVLLVRGISARAVR